MRATKFSQYDLVSCSLVILFVIMGLTIPVRAGAGDGKVAGGPFTYSLRGGAQSDSQSLGVDLRADFVQRAVNVHLFGTYDWLENSDGIGEIDNQRYGAGIAFSHTFLDKGNLFIGSSFINELDETFGHAYIGGQVKASEHFLLSGSYGVGFGDPKDIFLNGTLFYETESVDRLQLGGVWASDWGTRGNLSYYLADPSDERISGLRGELSVPLTDSLSLGTRVSVDITQQDDIDRNWRSYLFLSYSTGQRRERSIDLEIERGNVLQYPHLLRKRVQSSQPMTPALTISPMLASVVGYTGDTVLFTAGGGVAPYSWSNSGDGGSLNVVNSTQAMWDENYDFCDIIGTSFVTVTDSVGSSVTATIDIPTEDC